MESLGGVVREISIAFLGGGESCRIMIKGQEHGGTSESGY